MPDDDEITLPAVEWDEAWDEDVAMGLTPRAWLDSDPVPLTPDIDLSDTAQRLAWIRANNAVRTAREVELHRRRREMAREQGRGATPPRTSGAGKRTGSSTSVVGIRLLHEERSRLERVALHEGVTVSDLLRRWVRRAIDGVEIRDENPGLDRGFPAQEPGAGRDRPTDLDDGHERERVRQAQIASADATVGRITDDLRRLREMIAAVG